MLSGWIVLEKPLGLGSTQAVGAVKRALREGGYPKVKVGHGGTLDPLASGVLPIALGEATKLAGRMLDAVKSYEFTVRFGAETDTLDLEGRVVAECNHRPTRAEIEAILPRFTGPIEQAPPAYSAIKIDGERAYDRARAGEAVEMKSRRVTVYELEILPNSLGRGTTRRVVEGSGAEPLHHASHGPPPHQDGEDQVTFAATVSKGTYIRSLARDIAHALCTVGNVTMLRRTASGAFTLADAISLDMLFEKAKGRALEDIILPLRTALVDIPALALTPEQAGALRQGRVLDGIAVADGLHFAMLDETPVALVDVTAKSMKVERGFNL